MPRSDASERRGPGTLASDQLGAGDPTRAVCGDAESAPCRPQAAIEHATAIARNAILLSIARIAYRLHIVLHLLDEFAHFGKKPLLSHKTQIAQRELAPIDGLLEIA